MKEFYAREKVRMFGVCVVGKKKTKQKTIAEV